jgi:hypothetical protein
MRNVPEVLISLPDISTLIFILAVTALAVVLLATTASKCLLAENEVPAIDDTVSDAFLEVPHDTAKNIALDMSKKAAVCLIVVFITLIS